MVDDSDNLEGDGMSIANDELVVAREIDATGLKCPEPVMMLHAAIRKSAPGERIRLTATDPSTQRDVVSFCRFLDHSLVHQSDSEGVFSYVIQKAGS